MDKEMDDDTGTLGLTVGSATFWMVCWMARNCSA